MRLANLDGRICVAAAGGYADVTAASGGRFGPGPQTVLDEWDAFRRWSERLDREDPAGGMLTPVRADEQTRWGPPVPHPRQVFAIGWNYGGHAAESGLELPQVPPVFTKFPTCLAGPRDAVRLPAGLVDWEVELVVIIGQRCERVAEEAAWSRVAGVTVGQDLSERQLQLAGPAPQFSLGKSYPRFGPTGPELVTVDELPDPDDLELGCALAGGELLQKGRTSDLVFAVPELVARISAVCPLLPGDLIFTGTPSGVGVARTPPKFLAPGDVLVSWVEGVGELRNPMLATFVGPGAAN
jgi:2-keto-4-pentenoate hydratase/2-oxohepta-3-ene-1,7-dioic acid hydratase in catechol pathway